jgi:ribosome-associated protein
MSEDQSVMNDSQAKRAIQKLQKSIVKALEDIKAVDIRVFNTEGLSPLFERVIIASGNSNRQTKALAASVRDQLREDGFPKPRSEGEENGEWIIVDCGAAVVHIMQPAIRQYYHLEDIWGEKPIRLRATDKGMVNTSVKARALPKAKVASKAVGKAASKTAPKSPTTGDASRKAKPAAKAAPSRSTAGLAAAKSKTAGTKTTTKTPAKRK